MRRHFLLLPLLLTVAAAVRAEEHSVEMLVYPNAGIFEVEDGKLGGPGAVMLARLEAASGVRLIQQVMPIARALQTLVQKPGTCVVGLPRTSDRETLYRWAGPWASTAIGLYGRADEARRIGGPDDMRGASIAVLRDALPAAWLKAQGLQGHEVNDVGTGLRMLQAGRVDFWLGGDLPTRFAIKASSGPAPRVLYTFGRIDLYLACHPATSTVTVERMHAGVEEMREHGELKQFGVR